MIMVIAEKPCVTGELAKYPRTDSLNITSDIESSTRQLIDRLLSSGVYNAITAKFYDTTNVNMLWSCL